MQQLEKLLKDYVPGQSFNIIDLRDNNGWAPLHEAARWGRLDAVKYLIGNGADMNIRCNIGTPLKVARQENRINVVNYLRGMKALDAGPTSGEEDALEEET